MRSFIAPSLGSSPGSAAGSSFGSARGTSLGAALGALLLLGCGFSGATGQPDAKVEEPPDGPPPWWDPDWAHRRRVSVETGPVVPDKGYQGYTVAMTLDTTGLPTRSDCADLRLLTWTDERWTELPLHRLGCGAATDLRFALPAALSASTRWDHAYLYYGNPAADSAAPPPPVTRTNVYLWWDDATADRSASYGRGRMDPWQGMGYSNNLTWNADGYYTYDSINDAQGSYRIPVDERDVLVEAEWFHTGCQINNMQSGVCLRGIIAAGTGANEIADHYYCSSRGQNSLCNDNDQAAYDGDIVKDDNEILAVINPIDPPPIATNQWRKQALAAFGVNPTTLKFWDADSPWTGLASPPASALAVTGPDATDHEGRGFAGLMTSQDTGRFRNLVIRRYVEPEPVVSYGVEESPPP